VIVVAVMAPRTAVFGEGDKGLFDSCPLGLQCRTNFFALAREGGGEFLASGKEFIDLSVVEAGVTEVKTADWPADQRHANLPADSLGLQAPKSSPIGLVVLALNVLAVNSAPLVSAVRKGDHGRGGCSQGAAGSDKGQNSTGRKHSKPPVVEAAPRKRRLRCRPTRQRAKDARS
jgi:hypothetical protein